MASFSNSPVSTSSNDTAGANTTGTSDANDDADSDEENEKKAKEAAFQFMIGNYCVRRFLESAEKVLAEYASLSSPKPHQVHNNKRRASSASTLVNPLTKIQRLRRMFARKLRFIAKEKREERVPEVVEDTEAGNSESGAGRREERGPRRLMFGEISPTPSPSPSPPSSSDEKALLITHKKRREDSWEDGLLWYSNVRDLGATNAVVASGVDEEKESKRGCLSMVRKAVEGLGRKVARVLRGSKGRRCLGGFRALDG